VQRIALLERTQSAAGERATDPPREPRDAETEQLVGAALFEVANLSRRLGVDPEQALRSRALAFREWVVEREKEGKGFPVPDAPTH
jgi:hypothetical protein